VDVSLEQEAERVAVEVSVTTGAGHEMGNVAKRLAAGYSQVSLLVPSPRKAKLWQERASSLRW